MLYHTKPIEVVAKEFNCNLKTGLKNSLVKENERVYGKNVITPKKKKSFVKRLIEALSEPTLVILEFAWVVTVGVNIGKFLKTGESDFYECIGILACILLSAFLTLFMEGRSQKAFEMLGKVYDKIFVKVVRDGVITLIPKEQVVCGDIVILESGNKIIADGRVIESNGLLIDESMLTGESQRVEKVSNVIFKSNTTLAERKNMVFSGAFVGSGQGKMIVTAVGDNAELGKIATELGEKETSAPLNEKLNKLGKTVTVIGGVSAGIVFVLSIARLFILNDFNFFTVQDAFLDAIVLIVAAVPEGLPTTAALSLSFSVVKLAKSNALIKKLVATETAGAISIICSDKTGTLTQNQMTVIKVEGHNGNRNKIILNSAINSTAQLKMKGKSIETFGSATESALLKWLIKSGIDYKKLRDKRLIGRVLPFDSANKYMVTEYFCDGISTFFIKGAPEIIVKDCSLTEIEKTRILNQIQTEQDMGRRVIAFSSYKGDVGKNPDLSGGIASFDGYAVISDPVRPEIKESVKKCKEAGIRVMMMTGDNLSTATAIALEIGIIKDKSEVVSADVIDSSTNERLRSILKKVKVVARSTPSTKLKIVDSLKKCGEVVAVTGDGVNDAPAISKADIGVAMGSGSEITKEASDIVLLDDSFATIVKAISFGRNIYKNFQRFITFQLTVNLTAMVVVIISLIKGLVSPFTAVQLLWIDIIMDGPPALTLAMEADKGEFMKSSPVKRSEGILTWQMLIRIVSQGVFMSFIILMQYLYDFLKIGREGVSTSVFCIFVIFQLFNAFNCRKIGSESIFKDLMGNKIMLGVFALTFVFQIVITQFMCGFFGTVPLSLFAWIKIISVCLLSVIFSEICKFCYKILKNGKLLTAKKTKKLN